MNTIDVIEVVSPGCVICKQVEEFWEKEKTNWPHVQFRRVDVVTDEGMQLAQQHTILASPGLIINGELFSVGGFDPKQFLAKLQSLSS